MRVLSNFVVRGVWWIGSRDATTTALPLFCKSHLSVCTLKMLCTCNRTGTVYSVKYARAHTHISCSQSKLLQTCRPSEGGH